jgi:predicted Zn-dependent protease
MTARLRKRLWAPLFLLVSALGLGACAVNPATGERIITFGTTLADERRTGASQHPVIVKQFGGVYGDQGLAQYVGAIGANLARVSELPNIGWRFTVLNSEKINAFALPGGFVYVTRGLIALAGNEAELAGVIAHEIGHVTARHSTQRQSSGTLTEIGATAAGLLLGGVAGQLAGVVGHGIIQQYSQGQEFQADELGVRYISRLGYDAGMMASFLGKMRRYAALQNRIKGRPEGEIDGGDFFASHPRTLDRVERAVANARGANARGARPGNLKNRDIFMQRIDGMLFGGDPKEGILRGRSFSHPILGFAFDIPAGFTVANRPDALIAMGPGSSGMKFDIAGKHANAAMDGYIRNEWARGRQLAEMESMTVAGMPAATARTLIKSRGASYDIRFVAIRQGAARIYRFIFQTPPKLTQKLSLAFRRTTFSMRNLAPGEASSIKPLRIRVRAVQPGDTMAALAGRMAIDRFGADWFQVLNGLGAGAPLAAGTPVKLVVR